MTEWQNRNRTHASRIRTSSLKIGWVIMTRGMVAGKSWPAVEMHKHRQKCQCSFHSQLQIDGGFFCVLVETVVQTFLTDTILSFQRCHLNTDSNYRNFYSWRTQECLLGANTHTFVCKNVAANALPHNYCMLFNSTTTNLSGHLAPRMSTAKPWVPS